MCEQMITVRYHVKLKPYLTEIWESVLQFLLLVATASLDSFQ